MAGNSKIRITKNDRKDYERLARNAKNKINRTAKNYGVNLGNEIKVPKLGDITSREQFKQVQEQLRSFTNRYNTKYQFVKNEHGAVISKREKREIEEKTKLVQRKEKKLRDEAAKKPVIIKGEQVSTVGEEMKKMAKPTNLTGISETPDFDFSKVRDRKRIDQIKERLNERLKPQHFEEKMELLKANFILMLERSFNSDSDELAKRLRDIPADDFYEIYLMYQAFDFPEYYTKEHMGEAHDDLLEEMNGALDIYERGEMNMDMKPF